MNIQNCMSPFELLFQADLILSLFFNKGNYKRKVNAHKDQNTKVKLYLSR